MKPYYSTPDGAVRIYHARWEDVLAAGVFKPRDAALVHADPPYGIGDEVHRPGAKDGGPYRPGNARGKVRAYAPIVGNEGPFDPRPILALERPTVLWGGNHFASRLPDSASWLVWDKRDGTVTDDGSDCELAWTNLGGALRRFGHAWRGLARASECGVVHLHPTQKPEALSAWIFAHAMARKKLRRGDLVLVPYMGSGPDLRPALAAGLRVIACEVAEEYCRTAVSARLGAITPEAAREVPGPLFAR